jgi:hypothetical protein
MVEREVWRRLLLLLLVLGDSEAREGREVHGILKGVFASDSGADVIICSRLNHEFVEVLDDVLDLS